MKKPVRILHCLPGNMNQGGIENLIMNLYRNIDRNLIQFDFIVHSNEKNFYEDEIKKMGGKIYRVANKTKEYKKYKEQMEEIFEKHKEYSIIHIHATYSISILDASIAKKYGLKTIIHAHSSNDILKRKIFHYIMKKKLSDLADYKFACSLKAAEWLFTKKSLQESPPIVIKNAIDCDKFIYNEKIRLEQREKLGLQNKFVIGVVCRLSYLKNTKFLIQIFEKIYEEDKDSILLIVGDGPEKKKLMKFSEKLNLSEAIKFLGNSDDVNEKLQAMDVFVMPSKCEGFGISLLEAQAAGLKCFTSENVVPQEIKIKNNKNELEFISLKSGSNYWAKRILESKHRLNRSNIYEELKHEGYEIKESVKFLQKKYIEILGEK